jgi:hypothetical protein
MKRRGNRHEDDFEKFAHEKNWSVTKSGWPDFFCVKPDGSIAVVEIKGASRRTPAELRKLSKAQGVIMAALQDAGIECFLSDGIYLEPYERKQHNRHELRQPPAPLRLSENRGRWIHEYAIDS